MTNCLTIQKTTDYYCFTRSSRDHDALRHQLQQETHQENAQWLHLMLDNGQQCFTASKSFTTMMETISTLPHLKHFTISIHENRKLPVAALTLLLQKATQLESLHLHDISLENSPYLLAELLKDHPSLTTVSLIRCYCRPVHVLIAALGKMRFLKQVHLDGSIMAQQREGDALAALKALCRSQSLQKLTLGDLADSTMSIQLVALFTAMADPANKNSIQELTLELALYETLPAIVVNAIARMVQHNHTLQTLTVPWMGGAEMWLPLVSALEQNHGLKEFLLSNNTNNNTTTTVNTNNKNALSKEFLRKAAAALRCNTHLTHFWYDSWEDKNLTVDLYLKANHYGRGYLLNESMNNGENDDNNTTPATTRKRPRPTHNDWVQAVVASHDHVHVTNYWLYQNPSLLVSLAESTTR